MLIFKNRYNQILLTKNITILGKKYLIIPIFENEHWVMVIVCYPDSIAGYIKSLIDVDNEKSERLVTTINGEKRKTSLYYFDSMGVKNARCLEIVKNYLVCEYVNKFGSSLPNANIQEKLDDNKVYRDVMKSSILEIYPIVINFCLLS